MSSFKVRVTKDYAVFCAGHFITYEGDKCEPLHGHNYRTAVSLEGDLDENSYVFNFVTLKKLMRGICDRLDHRMLLPLSNARIKVEDDGDHVRATYNGKRYLFPKSDVVLLPIPNTTAEMLACWIAGELRKALDAAPLGAVEVEVEESFGQRAFYREELRGRG